MNEYEAIFILDPEKEEALKKIQDSITQAIIKSGGKVTGEENWGKKRLSVPIRKKREGVYCKLDFTAAASEISVLNNNYRLNNGILRVMITKKRGS